MYREAELPFFFDQEDRRNGEGGMAKFNSLLNKKFTALRSWFSGVLGPRPGMTLAELLIGNFADMREWGARTKPRQGRED